LNDLNKIIKDNIIKDLKNDMYDETKWILDSKISNVYNRLILFKKELFYSSSMNFGIDLNESRLIQYFSFGVSKD
jgi:hypothetical protein